MSSTLANNQGTDYRRSLTNPYWQVQAAKATRPTLTSDGVAINGPAAAVWIPPQAPEGKVYHYLLLPSSEEGAMATNNNDVQVIVDQDDQATTFVAEDSQTAWGELVSDWDALYPARAGTLTVVATPTWIPGAWTDYALQVEADPQWVVEGNQSGLGPDVDVMQTIDGDGAVEVYGLAKAGSGETGPLNGAEWTLIEEIPLGMEGTRYTLAQDVGDCSRVCVVLRDPLVSKVYVAYGTL